LQEGAKEILLFSFHGIPQRYFEAGDPYFCECHKTGRLVAEKLGLQEDQYRVTFQSLFGREEWLRPYTEEVVKELSGKGTQRIEVVCPGFAIDCLETLEEVNLEIKDIFLQSGGKEYRYIPSLNDRPEHVQTLAGIAMEHLTGWVVSRERWDRQTAEEEARYSEERYRKLKDKDIM
jgi:ferrochelatase